MLHKDIYICCMENCNILYVAVILYVRMWIEMSVTSFQPCGYACHPLCEDVDWNKNKELATKGVMSSSSMWGCGLKSKQESRLFMVRGVILYVRMWIEIWLKKDVIPCAYVILYARMWIEMIQVRDSLFNGQVILRARMWIEIVWSYTISAWASVILRAKMWIEIFNDIWLALPL